MARNSAHVPNKLSPNAPLDNLIERALRRYGAFSSGTVDGEFRLLMLDFANLIIEDLRIHPYWTSTTPLNYYVSSTETRPIPDEIMVSGLAFYFAAQQESPKAATLSSQYYGKLNSILYEMNYGNAPITIGTPDGPAPSPARSS